MSVLAVATTAAPDRFAGTRAAFERVLAALESQEAQCMDHSDLEEFLGKHGRELLRQMYQDCLDARAPGEAEEPVVDAEGKERTRKRVQRRGLETLFGPVTVERMGYGAEGEASLHPLDSELNLPGERYSHALRRRAAEEASKNSFDETVEALRRYTGAAIPKRQVEELVSRAAQDFDAFYEARRQELEVPHTGTGSVLVITSDSKGVVMRKDDLRPATRKAATQQRLRTRLSKGEKRNQKRMATVAAVYTVAPYVRNPEQVLGALLRDGQERPPRPRPEDKRVWASLEHEPQEVLEEAFHEAFDRDPMGEKTWVAVVDGHESQLATLEALAEHYGARLTVVLDIIHVLEYLWKAAHAFAAEGSEDLERWVFERLLRILQGQASQVAAGMRRSATKRALSREQRAPVDRCANYLLKYKPYLAYDRYLAAGFPIGSGVIEGACRHLVNDRLGITGARWRLPGAEAVLRLRALRASGDFDEYWRFHKAREKERNHLVRYAEQQPPTTKHPFGEPSQRPHLKRLK